MKAKDIKTGDSINLPNIGNIEVTSMFHQYGFGSVTIHYKKDGVQYNYVIPANRELT